MDARQKLQAESIRVGTLVNAGGENDPSSYIRQIAPHGFESYSITFWQTLGDTDLTELAKRVVDAAGESGATIGSVGVFGNALGELAINVETRDGWHKLVDAAPLFGTDIVAGFAGRVVDESIDKSMDRYAEVFGPIASRAQDLGLKLAFENCDMGGTWNKGDWNIAHNPTAWEMMFNALPHENIGLQWEPCHQMVSLIDPMPQLRKWVSKINHVHGKDASIHWDVVREFGVHGPKTFAYHRHPGFGDSNWTDIISELRKGGYAGSIDIEGWHDPVYKGELEMTGQVHALNYLKNCRGGSFVPNPK